MENKITTAAEWQAALSAATTPGKADTLSRFFKTGKGEYGEGDKFIGVMVPANRQIAKQTLDAPLQTVAEMLASEIHEHRLSALLSLVERYRKARKDPAEKHRIAQFYLTHTNGINNWDLVDLSAPYIIGDQIMEGNDPTPRLLDSANLWEHIVLYSRAPAQGYLSAMYLYTSLCCKYGLVSSPMMSRASTPKSTICGACIVV